MEGDAVGVRYSELREASNAFLDGSRFYEITRLFRDASETMNSRRRRQQ